MGAKIDLKGQRFGRLVVIKELPERRNGSVVWRCQCDCGNFHNVDAKSLRTGGVKSCGCLKQEKDRMPKGNIKNLIGQTFGHLTVVERDGSDHRGEAKWKCKCDCGNPELISVLGSNLRTGHTRSCGCDRRSHGEQIISEILTEHNIPFITEYKAFKFASGRWARFDFYVNNQYLIEFDGETHYKYNLHGWHNKEQLTNQIERDSIKDKWCKENGIPLIRIPYTQLSKLTIEDLQLETTSFLVE